jgi:hypothetical protein
MRVRADASRAAFNIGARCASEDGAGSLRRKTKKGVSAGALMAYPMKDVPSVTPVRRDPGLHA